MQTLSGILPLFRQIWLHVVRDNVEALFPTGLLHQLVHVVRSQAGNLTHGHPTRMGRVWVAILAHGQDPWATRLVMGRAWVQTCAHGRPDGQPD